MANTTAQLKAEAWVTENFLSSLFDENFSNRKIQLKWGGNFKFDAVSPDGTIIGNISTSSARTAGNKLATAKIQKIKCDTLYLLFASKAKTRLLIFTEKDMHSHFKKEVQNGRFPKGIKLLHAPLPDSLQREILSARLTASNETSPRRIDVP